MQQNRAPTPPEMTTFRNEMDTIDKQQHPDVVEGESHPQFMGLNKLGLDQVLYSPPQIGSSQFSERTMPRLNVLRQASDSGSPDQASGVKSRDPLRAERRDALVDDQDVRDEMIEKSQERLSRIKDR